MTLVQASGVPDYEVVFSKAKTSDYCLVIPVINEGERIGKLLNKIQTQRIDRICDIILCDGGSTDGSLEHEKLCRLGVKVLLVKKGAGRLSSQLRCAYHFALGRAYEGILTIDGNNKDDPAPIPAFIEKLKEGYDFVQASRFIAGGEAVNTPASRTLAIRLLHAPLLSAASGFHWTDTTQGFRAYSAKLLKDPQVAVFRDVFRNYELLAYLSYRAPKLGFRCIEMPSRRIYPVGKVPTKISFVKGNAEVFKVLLKTCLGKYNPETEKTL